MVCTLQNWNKHHCFLEMGHEGPCLWESPEGQKVRLSGNRPDWDNYFMEIAYVVAKRATCNRKHVGAVIVNDKRIVSTGYNGSPAGMPHCDDVGHLMKEIDGRQSCVRTLHAESNALDDAGRKARGGQIYVTVTPCLDCAKRIVNAGMTHVTWYEHYESRNTGMVQDFFEASGIRYKRPG